jgi:two-component system, response regulator PdtaR
MIDACPHRRRRRDYRYASGNASSRVRPSATAASTTEAIAQAALHSPEVVLMDIRLAGGSSGIEAARELYERQSVRCVFLSANLDESTRAMLSPYKPIDFIGMPILPVLLQRALIKAGE